MTYKYPYDTLHSNDFIGAEPEINYEGRVGVHKSMNLIMKGEWVAQEYIALCNKVHEARLLSTGTARAPYAPLGSATVLGLLGLHVHMYENICKPIVCQCRFDYS